MQKLIFEKISRTFKSTTISCTFGCATISRTAEVQALVWLPQIALFWFIRALWVIVLWRMASKLLLADGRSCCSSSRRRTFEQVVTMTIISATRACCRSQLWIRRYLAYDAAAVGAVIYPSAILLGGVKIWRESLKSWNWHMKFEHVYSMFAHNFIAHMAHRYINYTHSHRELRYE